MAASDAPAAADIEAGRVKAKPCNTCHGKDGIGTMPMFPNLAGQKALYLEQQLKAFRDGKRKSEVMTIVIKDLSDKDIEDLSAYYESLPHAGAGE
jgi:cytochrome c553